MKKYSSFFHKVFLPGEVPPLAKNLLILAYPSKNNIITNNKDRLFYPICLQNRIKVNVYAKFLFTFCFHHERYFGARSNRWVSAVIKENWKAPYIGRQV